MNSEINLVKDILLELKVKTIKLVKYPGNSGYTDQYNETKLTLEKKCKVLFYSFQDNKRVLGLIDEYNTLYGAIFNQKAKYKEKLKVIKDLITILGKIEIEIHDEILLNPVFSQDLEIKLKHDFETEISDLKLVYGRSGNCTAFILRKMLEKLLFLCFVRNDLSSKIEDTKNSNQYINLSTMINLASTEKIKNLPILTSKTAKQISGIKFLGDTSAHNYCINVNMQEIVPQMPFIISAFKELSVNLKK
jgi:hypothetical protein